MVEIKRAERMSESVFVSDSSCQDLIPSLWMISNPEKHGASSDGGAVVWNQTDRPAIVRIFRGLKLLLRINTGSASGNKFSQGSY